MKKQVKIVLLSIFCCLAAAAAQAQDRSNVGKAWAAEVSKLESISGHVPELVSDPEDQRNRTELLDFMYSNVAMGYFGAVYADSEYPDFWPSLNEVFRLGFPNPDDAYYYVPVDDEGVYRIAGYRGTVRILDFQISAGMANKDGTGIWGPALVNYDADQLHASAEGWFEVILSPQRPEGYTGDWWKLEKGSAWIMARQRSYDWLREVDGRFGIERLDRPAIQPRYSAAELAKRLDGIPRWAATQTRVDLTYAKASYDKSRVNEFTLIDFGGEGGFTGSVQRYPQTVFELEQDEALIVETEIPVQCRYWNFQVVDTLWRTMGGNNTFNSINGHQARLDADGKFRFVVSAKDPGVPNWLDNMGYSTGFVYGRWNICSSAPLPIATRVKLADVRRYLPTDTPVVSSAERDRTLRERRLGAQMRKRW